MEAVSSDNKIPETSQEICQDCSDQDQSDDLVNILGSIKIIHSFLSIGILENCPDQFVKFVAIQEFQQSWQSQNSQQSKSTNIDDTLERKH